MARKLNYDTLDVFTTQPYAGNQLGLVHVPSDMTLTQDQKQQIAIEFNYSETVILYEHSNEDATGTYRAQIFTPKSELPFAGHPTIGTGSWIFTNLETARDAITLKLKAGDVQLTFDRGSQTTAAAIPHNVRVHKQRLAWDRVVASQAKLAAAPAQRKSEAVPLVSLVPGMNFALVDLTAQPDLLNDVVVTKNDIPQQQDLDDGWPATLLGNVFYHIMPDQGDGIVRIKQRVMVIDLEDPATGAATGALTSYLALVFGGEGATYQFELDQGVEMGRASKIFAAVTLTKDGKEVEKLVLSGQAVEVMKGTIRL